VILIDAFVVIRLVCRLVEHLVAEGHWTDCKSHNNPTDTPNYTYPHCNWLLSALESNISKTIFSSGIDEEHELDSRRNWDKPDIAGLVLALAKV
jgi:hypothetical protein